MELIIPLGGGHLLMIDGGSPSLDSAEHLADEFSNWLAAGCPIPEFEHDKDVWPVDPLTNVCVYLESRPATLKNLLIIKQRPGIDTSIGVLKKSMDLVPTSISENMTYAKARVCCGEVNGVEHGVFSGKVTGAELGDLMRTRGAFYVPTLTVWNRGGPRGVANPMANLQLLHQQGVKIALGTDTYGRIEPGISTVRELELMVQAGLTPAAALQATTQHAAEHLGLARDLGTLERGKIADLLIVDGDPLTNIAAMRNVRIVVQSGRVVHTID